MPEAELEARIQAVRRFSRFYTRRLGVLHDGLLGSPMSLAEARVVFELAQAGDTTAARLAEALGLDAGYLSRLLRALADRGLVERRASDGDRRQSRLRLTEAGRAAFAAIDARSQAEVGAMLQPLPEAEQRRLVAALGTAERLLGGVAGPPPAFVLRAPEPGDMGWVVQRHGALYAREYGWDTGFEALVAGIVAGFVRDFDARRESCWIAERDGMPVGSVFLVRGEAEAVAKLRLLLIEPEARGLGLGRRLVAECVRFARTAGYRQVTLWTNDVLLAARRIYADAGFRLTAREPHRSFGHALVGETWELPLGELPL